MVSECEENQNDSDGAFAYLFAENGIAAWK